ncbi:MAG: NAD(P)H-hydrate dehydratase [Gemmiger formicilis]|nr:NAD(P)H-hydrate dehydratase [Gemmiger formicilis]
MQREITRELVRRLLPGRMAESNKGSYGSVLAAAGSMAYRGAAALCTEGALRGGAGLVYLASVEPVIQLVLSRTPECCACGCRTAANGGIHPQDADALNALAAGKYRGDLPANTILTPHPGEAARLLGLPVPEVQADREGAAVSLAEKYHCVAVLKGHHTLVAAPDGTVWRNETGNAGLAKGGSGDILAGLTAGLLAAGLKQGRTPEDAAVCAVWLHGAAADRCAKRRSMTAMLPGDLFEDLGWILGELGR